MHFDTYNLRVRQSVLPCGQRVHIRILFFFQVFISTAVISGDHSIGIFSCFTFCAKAFELTEKKFLHQDDFVMLLFCTREKC